MEKKQEKELLICALLLVSAVVLSRILSEDKSEKKSAFCGDCKSESCNECSSNASGDLTPPPQGGQKWVSSTENGEDKCRWYDKDGRNTKTYNFPCSKSQARMYSKK